MNEISKPAKSAEAERLDLDASGPVGTTDDRTQVDTFLAAGRMWLAPIMRNSRPI